MIRAVSRPRIQPSTHRRAPQAFDLSAFFERNYLRSRPGISAGSVEQMRITVRLFERFLGESESLRKPTLDDRTVNQFLCWLAESRSMKTVASKRAMLLAIWREAFEQGFVELPPGRVSKPKAARRLPEAWRLEQIEQLLAACGDEPTVNGWGADHWRSLVMVAYDTALRINALLAIRTDWLELDCRILTVPAEHQKNRVAKSFELHEQTVGLIQRVLVANPVSLFNWPWSRRSLWSKFRRLLTRSGLPAGRRDLFHKLRRTSYTQVWMSLGPGAATVHAGHSSDLSRSYLDPRLVQSRGAIDVLPRPAMEIGQ